MMLGQCSHPSKNTQASEQAPRKPTLFQMLTVDKKLQGFRPAISVHGPQLWDFPLVVRIQALSLGDFLKVILAHSPQLCRATV